MESINTLTAKQQIPEPHLLESKNDPLLPGTGNIIPEPRYTGYHGLYRSMEDVLKNAHQDEYQIHALNRGSKLAMIAPHGGLIEAGTSELARLIAQERYSLYSFEGRTYRMDPRLRVTSTYFDEPQCLQLLEQTSLPLVIHGSYEWGKKYNCDIYLGGLAKERIEQLQSTLEEAHLKVGFHPQLPGIDPRNICNFGKLRSGIQIELHPDLQEAFSAAKTSYQLKVAQRVVSAFIKFADSAENSLADS